MIYFGPATEVVDYFVSSPYKFACKPGANPADFVVAVAGSFVPAQDGRSIPGGELATYYASSDKARAAAETIEDYEQRAPTIPDNPLLSGSTEPAEVESDYPNSSYGLQLNKFIFQTKVLLQRRFIVYQKDRRVIIGPIFRLVLILFLCFYYFTNFIYLFIFLTFFHKQGYYNSRLLWVRVPPAGHWGAV